MEGQHAALKRILKEIGPCLVAFSGGVDSTLLLKVAHDVLGEAVTAVTAVSPSLAAAEREDAERLARLIGARHILVPTGEVDDPRYVKNDSARCFYCKAELFRVLGPMAAGTAARAIIYGAITDDLGDDRPGMRAAALAGARAPLVEAGFSKEMVRLLSKRLGLPTWDKPAMACLASRIPRNVQVTREALAAVEAAEAAVRKLGYRQVRVRFQGEGARVELDREGLSRSASPPEKERLIAAVVAAGFARVLIDPLGYRPGGGTS